MIFSIYILFISLLEKMQDEEVITNKYTFFAIVRSCGSLWIGLPVVPTGSVHNMIGPIVISLNRT